MNSVFHVGFIKQVNQYVSASIPTLYPLKTAENLNLSDVFWGYQIGTLGTQLNGRDFTFA